MKYDSRFRRVDLRADHVGSAERSRLLKYALRRAHREKTVSADRITEQAIATRAARSIQLAYAFVMRIPYHRVEPMRVKRPKHYSLHREVATEEIASLLEAYQADPTIKIPGLEEEVQSWRDTPPHHFMTLKQYRDLEKELEKTKTGEREKDQEIDSAIRAAYFVVPSAERRAARRRSMTRYFRPANRENYLLEHLSPSKKYKLKVSRYTTGKGTWAYSLGEVFQNDRDSPIAQVRRNYTAFPYCFVENHPDGHDYLVCGEDYQGQTVVQLDTGKVKHYLPQAADRGFGFCWAHIQVIPPGNTLLVEGCIWAGPYELVIYDFSDPMRMPWIEIQTIEEYSEMSRVVGPKIGSDGSISLVGVIEVRKSDGKPRYVVERDDDETKDDDFEEREVPIAWTRLSWSEVAGHWIRQVEGARKSYGDGAIPMFQSSLRMLDLLAEKLDPSERRDFRMKLRNLLKKSE